MDRRPKHTISITTPSTKALQVDQALQCDALRAVLPVPECPNKSFAARRVHIASFQSTNRILSQCRRNTMTEWLSTLIRIFLSTWNPPTREKDERRASPILTNERQTKGRARRRTRYALTFGACLSCLTDCAASVHLGSIIRSFMGYCPRR